MSLLGGIFGDAKDANPSEGANNLAAISERLLRESQPLRSNLINRYTAMTSPGGLSPAEQQELSTLQGLANSPGIPFDIPGPPPAPQDNPDRERGAPPATMGGQPSLYLPTGITDAQRQRMAYLESRVNAPANSNSGFDVTSSPQYASLKDAIDRQFSMARSNILATTPSGGALTRSLSNLEGTRAGSMAAGYGGLADQEMSRAFALGTGQTPVALGGIGSAAGIQGQLAAAQAAQQGQAMQGLGYGIGNAMGRKGSTSNAGSKGSTAVATME